MHNMNPNQATSIYTLLQVAALFLCSITWGYSQTVTPTLSNPSRCDTAWAIRDFTCPDNNGFFLANLFNIRVNNAPGTVLGRDVYLKEVRLRIQHQWAADLAIRLISPNGTRVILSMNNGGGEDNYGVPDSANCQGYVRFTTSACTPIDQGEAPFIDRPYLPQESFLNFNDNKTSANGEWQLLICDDSQQDTGRLEFVELIFAPLSCLPAQSVHIVSQDTTTVVLNWTPTDGCSAGVSVIEYGPPGFVPGIGAQAGAQGRVVPFTACPPYALQGLLPDTPYDIYVRRTCNGGAFSDNSCPISVRTGCLPPKPTTLETFNNQLICDPICNAVCAQTGVWRNAPGSTFNWLIYKDPTPTPDTGPDQDVSGNGHYAYIETTGFQCANGSQAVLQSGCFLLDKKNSDTCHLSFYYHMYGSSTGTLRLEVSVDGGLSWQILWTRQGSKGNQWIKESLSLRKYTNGTLMQFRFVGIKGNGSLGDIGLDHIALHGSTYLGWPEQPFYADVDRDGYGNAAVFIYSCATTPPAGYVTNKTDCNDQNANINPGRPEVPCDNIDNNCNGAGDDTILLPPNVKGDTICSGEVPNLNATPVQGELIFWYTQPIGGTAVSSGQVFLPQIPANNGLTPVIYRYYAEAVDNRLRCFSNTRAEVLVVVNPLPNPVVTEQPEICAQQIFDLNRVKLQDDHFTQASLAFYRALPASASTLIDNPLVSPGVSTKYFFEMTSPLGCKKTGDFTLKVNPLPNITFSPSDSFNLCLESTQLLGASISGGTGAFRYLWSTGEETAAIRITAGTEKGIKSRYQLTITDAKACSNTGKVVVTTTNSIDSIRRSTSDVSVCNGNNGSITITPLNGLAPFSYTWNGAGIQGDSSNVPAGAFTITGLQQGSYRVTITDNSSRGCRFILRNALINGPGIEVRNIDIQPVTCHGAKDGQINLDVRGNPRFKWSNGDTTAILSKVPGGTYAVTITSATCSTVLDNLVLTEPDSVRVLATFTQPLCFASLDGRIDLSVFGGAGNFQYRWTNNSIKEDLERVARGAHAVTITDGAGCLYTRTFSLSSPALLTVGIDSNLAVTCAGFRNGMIRVSGRGGTAPYRYNWETGATLPVIRNLAAGNYKVTITDANNCTSTLTITVGSPAALQVNAGSITAPKCFGDTTGRIATLIIGGTAPYRYTWNTGQSTANLLSLGVGQYKVLVRDVKGCTADTFNVALNASSKIALTATINAPTCLGLENGIVTIVPRGAAPFRYTWEKGDTTNFVLNLGVGQHKVRIRDGQGCIFDTSFVLQPEKQPLLASITAVPPLCFGSRDGFINVQMLRVENPGISFKWNDGSTLEERRDLAPGLFSVTITDRLGCIWKEDSILLSTPPKLSHEVMALGQINCNGDSTGFIELAVSGGNKPYKYSWIGSTSTGPSAYRLPAGNYRLFVLDDNGCPLNLEYNLTQPSKLNAETKVQVGSVCQGDRSNVLSVTASGGTLPYSYLWSTGARTSAIVNQPADDYSVTVTDGNGCTVEPTTIKLRNAGDPIQLTAFVATDISCFGKKDGEVSASITGGTAPYLFVFNNVVNSISTSQTTVKISNLPADNDYQVLVVDAKGCQVTSVLKSISEPARLRIRRDSIRNSMCGNLIGGGVYVSSSGGNRPYSYTWYDFTTKLPIANTEDLTQVGGGSYYAIVHDARLCRDSLPPASIQGNAPLKVATLDITNPKCRGEASGVITVDIQGGRAPYKYTWNNRLGNSSINNLKAGEYTLLVSDSDSCKASFGPFTVSEPIKGIVVADTITAVQCNGGASGALTIGLSGGLAPYRWTWQNAQGQVLGLDVRKINNLRAGQYSLLVSDADNCSLFFTYAVPQPDPIRANFAIVQPKGDLANGSILAKPSGGNPPYRYRWGNNATTDNLSNIPKGTYFLTITDSKNCQSGESVLVMSTATLDFTLVEAARVFPNPTQDVLQVELQLKESLPLELELLDLTGRVVWRRKLGQQLRVNERIGLQELPSGTYLLRLNSEKRFLYQEFVAKLND
ncbi:T9SS type A sorting domain-containing protein [Haliscomenobacter sp.]|uniref:T9SS type A sorting domain-containing protein n=1 Tax=Haliscomenobacter sp. TaxID=2717303 RepID=UPI003593F82E